MPRQHAHTVLVIAAAGAADQQIPAPTAAVAGGQHQPKEPQGRQLTSGGRARPWCAANLAAATSRDRGGIAVGAWHPPVAPRRGGASTRRAEPQRPRRGRPLPLHPRHPVCEAPGQARPPVTPPRAQWQPVGRAVPYPVAAPVAPPASRWSRATGFPTVRPLAVGTRTPPDRGGHPSPQYRTAAAPRRPTDAATRRRLCLAPRAPAAAPRSVRPPSGIPPAEPPPAAFIAQAICRALQQPLPPPPPQP